MSTRPRDNTVETINAAATAIAAAEARHQQDSSPRRRGFGCFSMYWCFGSQRYNEKHSKHAVVIPESTPPGSSRSLSHIPSQPSAHALPFVAPPSSPASFLQSEPPSVTHSPVNMFSLGAGQAYSPGGPASIFAIGPYANEMQPVTPPGFSSLTTEPSTAPLTPPEFVPLTTPSSPEVPFAQLLLSSDSNIKREGYGLHSYQLHPGSPIGNLISPSSVCSGTSTPFPDLELHSALSSCLPTFPIAEPPKLLNAEGLARRKAVPRYASRTDGLPVLNQIPYESVGETNETSCTNDPIINRRVSFELAAEEAGQFMGKESDASDSAQHDAYHKNTESVSESRQSMDDVTDVARCLIDANYHDLPEKLKLSPEDQALKEFKFDNADGTTKEPTIEPDWWTKEKVVSPGGRTSKEWAFFPVVHTGVS